MAANLLPGVEYDAPNSVLRETTILFPPLQWQARECRTLAGSRTGWSAVDARCLYAQFRRAPLSKAAIPLEVVMSAKGSFAGLYAQSYAGKRQYHWLAPPPR